MWWRKLLKMQCTQYFKFNNLHQSTTFFLKKKYIYICIENKIYENKIMKLKVMSEISSIFMFLYLPHASETHMMENFTQYSICMFQVVDLVHLKKVDDTEIQTLNGQLNCIGSLRKIDEMPQNPQTAPDDHMAFVFNVHKARFNDPGAYFLKAGVRSSVEDKDFSSIKVQKNDDRKFDHAHEVESDIIDTEDPVTYADWPNKKWTFFLPKGT